MNADRMTQRVQEALNDAYQRALREHHTWTMPPESSRNDC